MSLDIGTTVDRRYLLKREIARGGCGAVFEAEHLYTKRAVAMKLLLPSQRSAAELRARLLREALALSAARHPGIVAALDAGETEEGMPYLVLELLEGRSLEGILAVRRRLEPADVVWLGISLCDAIASAHRMRILHRDIKPSNIFVARNEQGEEVVKLFDFGVARVSADDNKLTQPGALLGTPEYMAPEQLLAHEIDERADLYSLGVTLYECLTGSVPFEGNFGEVLLKVTTLPLPPLKEKVAGLPAPLAAAIECVLAREASERFADARTFGAVLRNCVAVAARTSLLGIRQGPPPLPLRNSMGAANAEKLGGRSLQGGGEPSLQGGHRELSLQGATRPLVVPPMLPVTRRRFARAPYVTPVQIVHSNVSFDGRSEDISVGGLLVLGPQAFEEATLVQVRFALPMTGQIITSDATARWVKSAGVRGAIGLEFSSLPSGSREIIERYVAILGGQ